MKITLLQTNIVWENKSRNLKQLEECLKKLQGTTDLAILPEMFSTGFTMNSHLLAEKNDGTTITTIKRYAKEYGIALCGSHIAEDNERYYNRGFFITPEGDEFYYDKKHLFRMGDEITHFSAGEKRMIISWRGWNICLLICYELRFPVWSRNINNEYDLLIYVANWPASRQTVWDTLLPARALENMSYVCGVNRVGTDGNDLLYHGGSVVYSPKGKLLASVEGNQEGSCSAPLDLSSLREFREKFPVWMDADNFSFVPLLL